MAKRALFSGNEFTISIASPQIIWLSREVCKFEYSMVFIGVKYYERNRKSKIIAIVGAEFRTKVQKCESL